MKVSLIVSTYNRPDALRLVLLSVARQSRLPGEVIIGDDGSTDETRRMIDSLRNQIPVEIKHVWHEDKGFRLAMMRNKCIAASSGEYIVEIDGDVILHKHFIKDHLAFAAKGYYVKGGRTNLGKVLTARMCREGKLRPIGIFTRGIESKPENSLHLPAIARYLAMRYRRNKESALGCNMSFFRDDIIAVNGYDEYYEGWGGEDGDLGRRLKAYGLKKRHLKFAGIVYHLWHRDLYMYNKERNCEYSCRPNQPMRCKDGIDKYLNKKG
ncbi:MAG: glycosyltransferase family 2 protein [Clostridium sp.]|nr:glycosyltransferase family 2 protein [Clostridium sp.]